MPEVSSCQLIFYITIWSDLNCYNELTTHNMAKMKYIPYMPLPETS